MDVAGHHYYVVAGIAIFWVSSSELASAAQDAAPNSPFFTMYFALAWLSIFLLHPAVQKLPPRLETASRLSYRRAIAVFLAVYTGKVLSVFGVLVSEVWRRAHLPRPASQFATTHTSVHWC